MYPETCCVEADVAPAKREEFSLAKTGAEGKNEQRIVTVVSCNIKEQGRFLVGQGNAFCFRDRG